MGSIAVGRDVLLTELRDGTGVLLHLGTKSYYSLNRTGVEAWKLLADRTAADRVALAHRLAARFEGVTQAQALLDVSRLLRELAGEGLVVVEDS